MTTDLCFKNPLARANLELKACSFKTYLLWKRQKNRQRREGRDGMKLHKCISIGNNLKVKYYSLVAVI